MMQPTWGLPGKAKPLKRSNLPKTAMLIYAHRSFDITMFQRHNTSAPQAGNANTYPQIRRMR